MVLSVKMTTTIAQRSTTSIDWDAAIDKMLANASAIADKVSDDDVYVGIYRAVMVFAILALIEIVICLAWRGGRAFDRHAREIQHGTFALDVRITEMDQLPADG